MIAKGEANGWKRYRENLEWYRTNQAKVFNVEKWSAIEP